MTFPVTIGVVGWVIALVTLIIILVLMLLGQVAVWPLGILLCALAISRLI